MDVVVLQISVIYFTIMFVISFLQENILVPTIQKYCHCLYRNGKQFWTKRLLLPLVFSASDKHLQELLDR
jgi:hypothetical protein